jgi:hypothetical protein
MPNNECIRDIPINNTLSNSVVRKLSYITPIKEKRYMDYERPSYEQQRSHTITYLDEEYFPRRYYIDRKLTEIPSHRIKYIDY